MTHEASVDRSNDVRRHNVAWNYFSVEWWVMRLWLATFLRQELLSSLLLRFCPSDATARGTRGTRFLSWKIVGSRLERLWQETKGCSLCTQQQHRWTNRREARVFAPQTRVQQSPLIAAIVLLFQCCLIARLMKSPRHDNRRSLATLMLNKF